MVKLSRVMEILKKAATKVVGFIRSLQNTRDVTTFEYGDNVCSIGSWFWRWLNYHFRFSFSRAPEDRKFLHFQLTDDIKEAAKLPQPIGDIKTFYSDNLSFTSDPISFESGDAIFMRNRQNKLAVMKVLDVDNKDIRFEYLIKKTLPQCITVAVGAFVLIAILMGASCIFADRTINATIYAQTITRETRSYENKHIQNDAFHTEGKAHRGDGTTLVSAQVPWKILHEKAEDIVLRIEGYGEVFNEADVKLEVISDDAFVAVWGYHTKGRWPSDRKAGINVFVDYTEWHELYMENAFIFDKVEMVSAHDGREAYLTLPMKVAKVESVLVVLPNKTEITLTAERVPEKGFSFEYEKNTNRVILSQGK